jgi:hypothetical protein
MLPRLQLFEFNDQSWTPTVLRQSIVEALSRTLDWAHVLRPLVAPFREFLAKSQAETVIDVAAGAGGPAAIFLRELEAAGASVPRWVLTDFFPAVEAWRLVKARFPAAIDYVSETVDATDLPPELTGARVIINALHHFPPELAQRALLGACKGASGVFVAEGLVRNPLSFAAMAPMGFAALMAGPVLTSGSRLERAAWAWLTPIALLVSVWDGIVSTFRCYSEAELRAMVAPLGDEWEWTFGEFKFNALGRGTWFSGVPRRPI